MGTAFRTLTFSIAELARTVAVLIASRMLAWARSLNEAKTFILLSGTQWQDLSDCAATCEHKVAGLPFTLACRFLQSA